MICSQIAKAGIFNAIRARFSGKTPNSLEFLVMEHELEHSKSVDHAVWRVPGKLPSNAILYGARDAFYTFALAKYYKHYLSFCPEVVNAEMGSIPVFAYMNLIGLPCNVETIKERLDQYQSKADELREHLETTIQLDPEASLRWYEAYYKDKPYPKKVATREALLKECQKLDFNPTSPQVVCKWLLSFVPVERISRLDNKTGKTKITGDKTIMFTLASEISDPQLKENLIMMNHFRSIEGASKKFKTYLESYDPRFGSIYCSYSVLAKQGTGRSSSGRRLDKSDTGKENNVQNISKKLPSHSKHGLGSTRSIVQARDGYVLAEFDAAASHLQIARHLSQDPSLIEAKRSGVKEHYYTLSGILVQAFNVHLEPKIVKELVEGRLSCDPYSFDHGTLKHLYKLGKNVIYSFLNYAGAATLQQQFFKQEVLVSFEECKSYLEACAKQYNILRRFQDKNYESARNTVKPFYIADRYIGHFATLKHLDGGITYHQGRFKQSAYDRFIDKLDEDDEEGIDVTEEYRVIARAAISKQDIYIKVSDLTAPCWLRPESTMMKTALAKVFQFQIESGYDFRVINFSHDSFMLEIAENFVDRVAPFAFDTLNDTYKAYIPDYEGEGTYNDCVLGHYWEKP
jgi:hypothetical protein